MMKLAVAEIAGKQYLVREGEIIKTDRLKAQPGDKVTFPRVLLLWNGKNLSLGQPYLEGYSIEGAVLEEGKGPKIVVYKYKRRKGYRRKTGHRQRFFTVKVDKIVGPSRAEKAAPEKEEATEKKIAPKKKAAVKIKAAPKKKEAPKKKATLKKAAATKKVPTRKK